ncbi:MAG: PASTA domain-containing protein [Proteobacteria bacterium]|nr:PASTA domain-containing protein [Pseudomonadota bacterium]
MTVTDSAGNPVGGLTASSFTVTLDGTLLTIQPSDFSLPPSENPATNVSVVFVMDYSASLNATALAAMEGAVVDFINSMSPGDYAAIVKFNLANPAGASIVQPFTLVDGGAGTDQLVNAAMLPYPGSAANSSNLYDGINVALDHFVSPPAGVTLPTGPKAVVAISDGLDNASINTQSFVLDKASSLGIPLFTIAVGTPGTTGSNVMNALAARTGGNFISAPSPAEVTDAYVTISSRLDNGYLLSFVSSITDCNQHTLSVTVAGQTTETRFTRCDATTGPVTVPNVVNQTQAAATTAITSATLVVGTVTQQSSATVPAGRVSSQNPSAGVGVAAGSALNLVVSTGPVPTAGPVAVPNVLNLTQPAATTAITSAGLVLGTVSQSSSATVPAGSVISQNPSAGTNVTAGSAVSLIVPTGPVAAPNVVSMTQAAATTAISFAGLAIGTISQQSSATVASGSVISQNPAAGTNVVAGSAVALVVSTGAAAPPPPPPPSNSGGGGGGGSLGLGSLALGLVALMARRRRRASIG